MSPHKWIIAAAITLLPCLPANAEATSPPAKTRVACIGNSITYGMTLPDSLRMPVGLIGRAMTMFSHGCSNAPSKTWVAGTTAIAIPTSRHICLPQESARSAVILFQA